MNELIRPNNIITCTRRFQFCAGHRVLGHEGRCKNIHGHNYVALITCMAPRLDSLGRVIDFSEIKRAIGSFIDTHWDHGFLVNVNDRQLCEFFSAPENREFKLFTCDFNPTAEEMAEYLLNRVCPLFLPAPIEAVKVKLWETENCYATALKGGWSE